MKSKAEWARKFRHEGIEHLRDINRMMHELDWQRTAALAGQEGLEAEQKQLRQLFVRIHGLKGTAGMVGLTEISAKAAELEALWGEVLLEPSLLTAFFREMVEAKTAELTSLIEALKTE